MKGQYKLELGGQERTLLFGRIGFYSYIGEHTKADPLEWFNKLSGDANVITRIEDVALVVYAGLNTYLDEADKDNIPFEKVKKWCNALSVEEMSEVVSFAFESFVVKQGTESEGKKEAPSVGQM